MATKHSKEGLVHQLNDSESDLQSLSSLHSRQLSTPNSVTRSKILTNNEQKIPQPKTGNAKILDRAKRTEEKVERVHSLPKDSRRRVEREEEGKGRRNAMDTSLIDLKELQRIERQAQKRSQDRMRTITEWYAPATSGPLDEVQPVFAATTRQAQSNQENSSLQDAAKPQQAAAIKDEEERREMEKTLQQQLTSFASKLKSLEQLTESSAQVRAGPRRQRRRVARKSVLLTPLRPAHSNLKAVRSIANLSTHNVSKRDKRLGISPSLQVLRPVSRLCVDQDDMEDIIDDANIDDYLLRYRKTAKQVDAAVKVQAMWRMYLRRCKFVSWKQRRTQYLRTILELWVMIHRIGGRARYSILRKGFQAWHVNVTEALQLREMELHLFRQAATQTEIPRMVLNLLFTSDGEDEWAKSLPTTSADTTKKTEITVSSKAVFLSAFLNSGVGAIELARSSRVHRLRAQYVAVRVEIRKKVAHHVFRLWKRVHDAKKRVGLNAQLCLKRAVRMALDTRQRWPAELLLAVFEIWARWAAFTRAKRLGLPLPSFLQSNPYWDIWLHNYQERQVRYVKALAKAPSARLRRYFLLLVAFTRHVRRKRNAILLALEHFSTVLKLKVLRQWRQAIAEAAATKRRLRDAFQRMHRYAYTKRQLGPLEEILRRRQQAWQLRRMWQKWQRVQAASCFKRELSVARLETSPTWRSRIHRTLIVWRNDRKSLLLLSSFGAWVHFLRQRKLFLTLCLLCARVQRRHVLSTIFCSWKAVKCEPTDDSVGDSVRLDAWDAYEELSIFFPMMFKGSFSDPGLIFEGLSSHTNEEQRPTQDCQQLLSDDAVRHFHDVLVRGSVMEVRRMIRQTRHLINAVDGASGNTALHVAAQFEDGERRVEVLSLLLSQGAATVKRVNHRGLSPLQIAPDPNTRRLLEEGVFEFHSRNILNYEGTIDVSEPSSRLLWCITALMTRELGTGQRIPADRRNGQWYSTLRKELWLRQRQIRYAPDSIFAAIIARSRGFLHALKTRLCLAPRDAFDTARSRQLRVPTRDFCSSKHAEYEVYARYLLAPTLDTEACEQELIPSFVGVVYSLNFSIDEVLSQAHQLAEQCASVETEVWELYQRIQQAEKTWSALLSHGQAPSHEVCGLLRLFSDISAPNVFCMREHFLLEFRQWSQSDNGDEHQEVLAVLIDTLMVRMRRKRRSNAKKIRQLQDEIDDTSRSYRDRLVASKRSVKDIFTTKMALEDARLRLTMVLIKDFEVNAFVSVLEHAEQVLQSGERSNDASFRETLFNLSVLPPSVAALTFEQQKTFLERKMMTWTRLFQAKALLEESHTARKTNAQDVTTEPLPAALRPLQKEAVNKVHRLFMLNLFRSCCCWLAENMTTMDAENNQEKAVDVASRGGEVEWAPVDTETSSRKSKKEESTRRPASHEGPLVNELPQRQSGIASSKRAYPLSSDVVDEDNDLMTAKYAASIQLLFEEERRCAHEILSTTDVKTIAGMSEHNPVTGELEQRPKHMVSLAAASISKQSEGTSISERSNNHNSSQCRRNRKKEELQRAMMHHRLEPKRDDSDSDESKSCSRDELLPAIHGTEVHFGTFVTGLGGPSLCNQTLANVATLPDKSTLDSATAEAMWKRQGIKLTGSSFSNPKQALAHASETSTAREARRQGVVLQEPLELLRALEDVSKTKQVLVQQGTIAESASPSNK